MQTTVEPGDYPQVRYQLDQLVREALETHPLLSGTLTFPSDATLIVRIATYQLTTITHRDYQTSGVVTVDLNDDDVFDRRPDNSGPEVARLGLRTRSILYHELAHFLDARMNSEFRFDDRLRPTDTKLAAVHQDLWNAFIDGRLGVDAPHTLKEREEEAAAGQRSTEFIEAAWNGAFASYPIIVQKAAAIVGMTVTNAE